MYSQQDAIAAVARGTTVALGPRTAFVTRLVKVAGIIGLETVAAKLASLALLAGLYWRQFRIPVVEGGGPLFIGIDALREPDLVRQFGAMMGTSPTVIDQRQSGALASLYRPGWRELWRAWCEAADPLIACLANSPVGGVISRSHVLAYMVRRLHHYAQGLAVFRGLKATKGAATIAFSSADLPAYAAARAGIETVYFQHGFLRRSLVFPDFTRVIAFNVAEAEHIRSRLPAAAVTVPKPTIRPLKVERRLAVVGDYGDKLDRSCGLIEFCRTAGIDVVVRPHPADHSGYWNRWKGIRGVSIDPDGSFDDFLERHRPCIMATWYSTTISDALLRGVVPVTLEAEQSDVVFPVAEVALAWPKNRERIQIMLGDPAARHEHLARVFAVATEPVHASTAAKRVRQ